MPILVGGCVRWLVDRAMRPKLLARGMTETQITAEGDKSPGVLLASGYIAGGAIAGIIIAIIAGGLTELDDKLANFSKAHNPFFNGPREDLLSLLPFFVLIVFLYLVGRGQMLAPKAKAALSKP
jgi:hypothetical protein